MTHNCPHCGCQTGAEVLRRDVNIGRDPSWLVRYRDQHFVISTGHDGDTFAFRSSPDGKVSDWGEVAGGYGRTREQVLDDLTGRPVDDTGHVMSPRDVLDAADQAEEQAVDACRPLNEIMDFDHPVRIGADGEITDGLSGVYAPELMMGTDDDGQILDEHEADYIEQAKRQGWELLTGFTGQHAYRGPVMHPSEYVGGALADHIRETPGTYVVITVETDDDSEEPAGWAVARRIAPEGTE